MKAKSHIRELRYGDLRAAVLPLFVAARRSNTPVPLLGKKGEFCLGAPVHSAPSGPRLMVSAREFQRQLNSIKTLITLGYVVVIDRRTERVALWRSPKYKNSVVDRARAATALMKEFRAVESLRREQETRDGTIGRVEVLESCMCDLAERVVSLEAKIAIRG